MEPTIPTNVNFATGLLLFIFNNFQQQKCISLTNKTFFVFHQIWDCPDGGITENVTEALTDLIGHSKKVGIIQWHPSADNVLASAGFDLNVIVWDVGKACPVHVISCHDDVINSLCWNFDGSLLATSSKDKKARVIDPRKTEDQVVSVS